MTVVTSAVFNERFTIYLNNEGQPVQRTLAEMAPEEVLAAIKWHHREGYRLDREFHVAEERVTKIEKALDEAISPADDLMRDALRMACDALIASEEADRKLTRLMRLVIWAPAR